MSKNRIRIYIILAILLAVFAVIAFAIPFRRNAAFWISFVFGVIAIAVQLYSYPRAFDFEGHDVRSKFYGFPIARLTTIYLIVQLALSLVFMLLAKIIDVKAWIPLVLFVLALAAAAVGFIAADSMREEVERQDVVHKADVTAMRSLQSKSAFLVSQCEDAETKNALLNLAESFRFSDPVSSATLDDIEKNLTGLIEELGNAVLEKDFAAARSLCAKASSLLADRNRMCKLNKN